jgi:hypothetical protein
MIRTLLRLDPAAPTLRFTIPIAAAAGLVMAALAARALEGGDSIASLEGTGGLRFGLAQMWIIVLLFAIGSRFTARSAQMSMSLPLDPRRLWLARMISISYAALLPLAVMTALASAHGLIFSETPSIDAYVWRLWGRAAAGLLFIFAVVQSPSPRLYAVRGTVRYITCVSILAAAVLAVTLFGPRSILVTLVFFAAAVFLGLRTYVSLPTTFLAAPSRLGRAPKTPVRAALAASAAAPHAGAAAGTYVAGRTGKAGFRKLLNMTIFRLVVNHPVSWIMLPTAVFFGMLIPEKYYEGKDVLPYTIEVFVWITALMFQAIIRMKDFDPLPVSRRLLFAYAVLPAVVAYAIGIGISFLLVSTKHIKPSMVRYQSSVVVPVEFWEIAGEQGPPEVTAPWGESYVPRARPLFRGGETVLYNPFEHGEDSSYEYIDYQLRRAVEAVNGVPAPDEKEMMESEPSRMFREQVDTCCFTASGSEWRGSEKRSKTMATGSLIGILFVSLIYSLGLQQFRAVPYAGAYAFFLQLAFIPILVLLGAIVVADVAGISDFHLVTTYPQILMGELADAVPLGASFVWILVGAASIAGYLLVLWRFKRIELPGKGGKKASLGDY